MYGIGRLKQSTRKAWLSFQKRAIILLYHRVAEIPSDPYFLSVTPKHFAEHLEHIRKNYHAMSLSEFKRLFAAKNIPNKTVVITFDDGYVDNFCNATALLEQYGLPATIFISTGYIGQNREFWWDELERLLLLPESLPDRIGLNINGQLYKWEIKGTSNKESRQKAYTDIYHLVRNLNDAGQQKVLAELAESLGIQKEVRPNYRPINLEELKALSKNDLIDIGSHTITHSLLSSQPLNVQRKEIFGSKKDLEEILSRPVNNFSYPYGMASAVSEHTKQLVTEAGYDLACSTISSPVTCYSDPYLLPRCIIKDWNGEEFAQRVTNYFEVNKDTTW